MATRKPKVPQLTFRPRKVYDVITEEGFIIGTIEVFETPQQYLARLGNSINIEPIITLNDAKQWFKRRWTTLQLSQHYKG